ncbi:MAG TPA: hypothetical protein VK939_13945 [Longimicrobiales bacterium]|nr:hypothetical protein [Longimicrobiales bacterium]
MLRRIFAGASCILLLWSAGCARDASDDASGQAAASGVEAFFRYGMVPLGPSRAEFRAQLGAPVRVAARARPNLHDASATDTVVTLYYPELEADILRSGFDGRELLAGLRIASDRYLLPESPLRLDAPLDELLLILGPADATEDGDLVYRCTTCSFGGNDELRLEIDGDALRTIVVHYWIE